MLSSVPIIIGGDEYALQFTPGDMFTLEGELRKIGLPPFSTAFVTAGMRQALDMQAAMLYVGLKVPGKFDTNGYPVHVCPHGPTGLAKAQDLLRVFSKGRLPPIMNLELDQAFWDALSASEWYNLREMKEEAAASVPQEKEPPKNSEGNGSNPSSP